MGILDWSDENEMPQTPARRLAYLPLRLIPQLGCFLGLGILFGGVVAGGATLFVFPPLGVVVILAGILLGFGTAVALSAFAGLYVMLFDATATAATYFTALLDAVGEDPVPRRRWERLAAQFDREFAVPRTAVRGPVEARLAALESKINKLHIGE